MTDDGSKKSATVWPQAKFRFVVKWGAQIVTFHEVSGLDSETQAIEYRGGSSRGFSATKMPGSKTLGHVTLKKGVFKGDPAFWAWYKQIQTGNVAPTTVTISLLDEKGVPTTTWTLANARPTKITSPDVNASGNEVAIETIEFTHDGLAVANE